MKPKVMIVALAAVGTALGGTWVDNSCSAMQCYIPVDGGFEITNGLAVASRPLYGGHAIDNGRKPVKSVMYAGDDGSIMLSRYPAKNCKPCDGWLRFKASGDLVARYVWGHEEYIWPNAKVVLVREIDGDGLLAHIDGEVSVAMDGEWERLGARYCRRGAVRGKCTFDDAIEEMRRVATIVKVKTPDPLVNAAVAAQCVAADALWEDPCICHGAVGWHNGQGGWRGPYSVVALGQYERLKKNWRLYAREQLPDGRLRNYPWSDRRYNMAEVLVDSLMLYWKATGDIEFFRNEAYDAVKKHLAYEKETFGVAGTHLYENWLNAWNTDNKWCNGGAGAIASSYNYRAYAIMSEIARKLGAESEESGVDASGYKADAELFAREAAAIRKDAKCLLWDEGKGVFGEYRDIYGRRRLQNCPDASSIYTPIDCGLATCDEARRMLAWMEGEIPSRVASDGASMLYSSNKLPLFYSTCGLYQQETLNVALAYWQSGAGCDRAFSHYRSCLAPMARGVTAGPGTVALELSGDLTNRAHVDFGDVVAQVLRSAVEGLFGIALDVPNGKVTVTPGFPSDWGEAEIETPQFGYKWAAGNGELGTVEVTKNPLGLKVIVNSNHFACPADSASPREIKTTFGNPKGEGTDYTLPEGCTLAKVDLTPFTNQNLRLLHTREFSPRIPNSPFVKDTPRTVGANGRSWWEDRGRACVPEMSDTPAVCVSLYDQFPDKVGVPVGRKACKVFCLVSLSTNPNQSWTENARLTVRLAGGEERKLSLVPPDNCDDWLNYLQPRPYALTGEQLMLGSKAHANRFAVDLGGEREVESIAIECIANETIAALVDVEVASGRK